MKKWLATIPDGKLPNNQMMEGHLLLIYRVSVVGIATRPQARWSEVQFSVNVQTGSNIH